MPTRWWISDWGTGWFSGIERSVAGTEEGASRPRIPSRGPCKTPILLEAKRDAANRKGESDYTAPPFSLEEWRGEGPYP
jgi:hypothetical protein